MKKNKKDSINLFFSAFLIIAFIVCTYFFSSFAEAANMEKVKPLIYACVFAVFGLLVFYATRVGEGKAVKRFSVVTLIVLDIPALYIVLAGLVSGLPLHEQISSASIMYFLAAAALGYGVPYTFLSGFETALEESEEDSEKKVLEGGIEADLEEASPEEEAPTYESDADEIVVDGEELPEADEMVDSE